MYLATSTRPDIAYTVSKLACFNSNPGKAHWAAVKHLFRYLKGTMDLKLTYGPDSSKPEMFCTYSDADFGMDPDTRRSTGGYLVCMGSGAVNWSSKLQNWVTLSTTEAEYVAAVEAAKEAIWTRNLLTELGYKFNSPSTIFVDNNSAIAVAKNPEKFSRVKHIDLRLYWLKEKVGVGIVQPVHCPTADMPADLLTKALTPVKVSHLRKLMGLE